jgi:hypothetical protein
MIDEPIAVFVELLVLIATKLRVAIVAFGLPSTTPVAVVLTLRTVGV